jgi:hypothetical protein
VGRRLRTRRWGSEGGIKYIVHVALNDVDRLRRLRRAMLLFCRRRVRISVRRRPRAKGDAQSVVHVALDNVDRLRRRRFRLRVCARRVWSKADDCES